MVTLKQKCTSRRKCRKLQKKERVFHKMLEERKQRSRIHSVRDQQYTLSVQRSTIHSVSSEINNYTPSELLQCVEADFLQCSSVWQETYRSVPVFGRRLPQCGSVRKEIYQLWKENNIMGLVTNLQIGLLTTFCLGGLLDQTSDSRLRSPDSRLQTLVSRLQTLDSSVQTPRLQTPDSGVHTLVARLRTPDFGR